MVDKKSLKKAAKEINEVCGMEPPIDVTQDEEALKEELINFITDPEDGLQEGDEFSDSTQEVIDALKAEHEKASKKEKGGKKVPAKKEVVEDDDEVKDVQEVVKPEPKKPAKEEKKPAAKEKEKVVPVKEEKKSEKKGKVKEEAVEEKEETPAPKAKKAASKAEEVKPAPAAKASKKAKVEEVEEDPDETVEEMVAKSKVESKKKVTEEVPTKKEKKVAGRKPGSPNKEQKDKTSNPMYLTRLWTCQNPEITTDEIQKKLTKMQIEANRSSVNIRRSEMLSAMQLLKELGKLK